MAATPAPDEDKTALLHLCAQEAVHLIQSIQPQGVLVAVDRQLRIAFASANLEWLGTVPATQALGQSLSCLLDSRSMQELQALWDDEPTRPGSVRLTRISQPSCPDEVLIHSYPQYLVMEFPVPPGPLRIDLTDQVELTADQPSWQQLFSDHDLHSNILQCSQRIAEHFQRVTGFDRVLIYRFAENWDGEVIAESRTDALPILLNHHFPATDIPAQVRELYSRNTFRALADTEAAAVPLLGASHLGDSAQLDLSHSVLRSFSAVHVQYLRNMGVRASFSVSLMVDHRLWGLIACHHTRPRALSFRLRQEIESLGHLASLQLANIESARHGRHLRLVRQALLGITELIHANDFREALDNLLESTILPLLNAQGCCLVQDSCTLTFGQAPPPSAIPALLNWLPRNLAEQPYWTTPALSRLFPPAADYASEASGILAIAMPCSPVHYLLWFRMEQLQTIAWAGNPEFHKTAGTTSGILQPRHSFEVWIETSRKHSQPFSSHEIDAAQTLSHALMTMVRGRSLRQTEHNYRLLAENSTDMISCHSADGRFLYSSPACVTVTGLNTAALEHLRLEDVAVPEDAGIIRQGIQSALQSGQAQTLMFRRQITGQRLIWLESTLRPIVAQSPLSSAEVMVVNTRDVTQRQELQLAAEHANHLMDRFLANMSHEIRTPLHGLNAFLDLALKRMGKVPPEKLLDYLNNAKASTQQLDLFVEELLAISRLHSGEIVLHSKVTDLRQLIEATHQSMIEQFAAKRLRLELNALCEHCEAQVDAGLFGSMLRHLLTNACEFSPAGGRIQIQLEDCTLQRAGEAVAALRMVVADEGVGIPEAELETVFERFAQSSRTDTGSGGIGLGLSISREIMHAHGGTLHAESPPEAGARLICRIPRQLEQ